MSIGDKSCFRFFVIWPKKCDRQKILQCRAVVPTTLMNSLQNFFPCRSSNFQQSLFPSKANRILLQKKFTGSHPQLLCSPFCARLEQRQKQVLTSNHLDKNAYPNGFCFSCVSILIFHKQKKSNSNKAHTNQHSITSHSLVPHIFPKKYTTKPAFLFISHLSQWTWLDWLTSLLKPTQSSHRKVVKNHVYTFPTHTYPHIPRP